VTVVSPRSPSPLTIVLPTHNRARHCAAQLRLFQHCGTAHPLVVADSSDPAEAAAVRDACAGIAEFRPFEPSTRAIVKFAAMARSVTTPFIALVPDDDVTFPHAIDAALEHLKAHDDCAVAQGYVLSFALHESAFDIHGVKWFVPTIAFHDPLQRHYHLMRRYQPFFWAVFRTEALVSAIEAALEAKVTVFQELTCMSVLALNGSMARLPLIHTLRGAESSLVSAAETHPLFWFLRDTRSFFSHYAAYRDGLARQLRARGLAPPGETSIEHLLDLIHATWLGREADLGMINHTIRQMLGDAIPPIEIAPQWPGWHEPLDGDLVHRSEKDGRRYVWRRAVIEAEPREEITITSDEIARVEAQLQYYVLP
jgi:glycosyltransferase domain-containing protein